MESHPIVIKSSKKGETLSFEKIGAKHARISLDGGSFKASVRAYDENWSRVGAFFSSLAESDGTWSGEKTFESLEGEILLNATTDNIGHLQLQVRCVHDDGDHWETSGVIYIDSGCLRSIADKFQDFS